MRDFIGGISEQWTELKRAEDVFPRAMSGTQGERSKWYHSEFS